MFRGCSTFWSPRPSSVTPPLYGSSSSSSLLFSSSSSTGSRPTSRSPPSLSWSSSSVINAPPVNQIVHFNSSAVVQNKFRTLKSFYHPAYCAIGKTLPTNPKFKDLKNRSIQPIQYNEKSFVHFSSIVQPVESLPLNP